MISVIQHGRPGEESQDIIIHLYHSDTTVVEMLYILLITTVYYLNRKYFYLDHNVYRISYKLL